MKKRKELILLPFSEYNDRVMEVTKEISSDYEKICYVTLNKTYRALIKSFARQHIRPDKFYFIDYITPAILKFDPTERCSFLDSVKDTSHFAELLLMLIKKEKIEALIFDSVSSLLVYDSDEEPWNFSITSSHSWRR